MVFGALTFLFSIVKSMQNYKLKRLEHLRVPEEDQSMTTTELEVMIQDAVDKATVPLMAEIDALADRVRTSESAAQPQLLDPVEPAAEVEQAKTMGRRREH